MEKIILTGSEGLIGKKIYNFLKKKFKVVGLDIKKGHNLVNEKEVLDILKKNKDAKYLINLHGYNDHLSVNKKRSTSNSYQAFLDFHNINLYSFYLTNINFIKICKKAKGIINFASLYGIQSPKHHMYKEIKNIFFVTSKYGVIGLTKYLASLYGKKININAIASGGVDSNINKNFKTKMLINIPKKRMMKTEELFGVIELLCSSKSSYINGSVITIDGGYSSW